MDSEIKIYQFKMVVIFAVVLHFIITKSNNGSWFYLGEMSVQTKHFLSC